MEKQPKRRVLSLSLSQPAKQNRKLKLKRHASAASENDRKVLPSEEWQESNNTRDSVEMNLSEDRTNVISSETNQLASKPLLCDRNETSITPIASQLRTQSIGLNEHDSGEICLDNKVVPLNSAATFITTRRGTKTLLPNNLSGHKKPSVDEEDLDFVDFVKPPCSRKKEKVPQKDSSLISSVNAYGDQPNENVGIEFSSVTNRPLSPSLRIKEDKPFKDKSSSEDQSSMSTSSNVSNHDKPSAPISVLKDEECFEVLQCPLCCRIFDKLTSKTSHLKSCASKHKVATHQLLEALELQRRQALERKALGLPAMSPSVEKVKKPHTSKKESRPISKMDSNLQLAMALSLSLQDTEKIVEGPSTSESCAGMSLDHFGFTSKAVLSAVQPRPTAAPLAKGKSKGTMQRTPALLTRTPEERQRIITEKVAMVLMEEVASGEEKESKEMNVKSVFLKECVDVDSALWAKSHTSPSKNDRTSYYVQNLRSFISPSKVEMGSKVMHLSQVVGRLISPTKGKVHQKEEDQDSNSLTDEDASSDASCHQQNDFQDPTHIEMELRAKLFNDWASMVNNSVMSDVAIYPQEGREIPAHKMVLHVRCPKILKDICRQRNPLTGNEVEVIMWSKTPHAAALAFLEYIYCGSVKSIRVLSEDLTSISLLADHYKVTDLKKYLKAISESAPISQTASQVALNVVKDFSEDCQNPLSESEKENQEPALKENADLRRASRVSTDMFASPAGTPTRSETDSIYSEITVQGVENRSSCSSPDMFCDDEAEQCIPHDDKRRSMENIKDSVNVNAEGVSITKTIFSNDCSGDRPPSRSSVSSEKTVIIEKQAPALPRPSSASSDKTVLVNNNSPPASPAVSNTSATTELLDFNQSGISRPGSSLNDSKRKHSDSSQDGDLGSCKRVCSTILTSGYQPEIQDNEVDFCDLTQDSDSNASFPVITKSFSGNSCDEICILPENDILDNDANTKSPEHAKGINNEECNYSGNDQSIDFNEHDNSKENVRPAENAESYVSPVWEGFEDLNYDDPFFNEPHFDLDLQPKTPVISPKAVEDVTPPIISNKKFLSERKSPVKVSTSSEEKCDDIEVDIKSSSDCEITDSSPTSTVISKQSKPSTSGFDALLDDSLNINDSILLQAEMGVTGKLTQREAKGTPVHRILSTEPDGVTPLANYSAMKTPELKKELQKYGLKPTLGKRKGKLMLRHIYNELHPWVPIETNHSLPDRISLSQPCSSSSVGDTLSESDEPNSRRLSFSDCDTLEKEATPLDKDSRHSETDSDSDSNYSSRSVSTSLQEIKYLEGDDDGEDDCEPKSQASSKRVNKADLPRIVSDFIRNDRDLHQKVLEYEPIWIEQLQADLLKSGFKCGMEALMTFLDEKCITFRSQSSGPRVRKKKPKSTLGKNSTKSVDVNYLSD